MNVTSPAPRLVLALGLPEAEDKRFISFMFDLVSGRQAGKSRLYP
jgi:hypothetical protein